MAFVNAIAIRWRSDIGQSISLFSGDIDQSTIRGRIIQHYYGLLTNQNRDTNLKRI